jgi:hypothetical protein
LPESPVLLMDTYLSEAWPDKRMAGQPCLAEVEVEIAWLPSELTTANDIARRTTVSSETQAMSFFMWHPNSMSFRDKQHPTSVMGTGQD